MHYFASVSDQAELLDYLGEPEVVTLHPWPIVDSPLAVLTRKEALSRSQVMIVRGDLGPPTVLHPGDQAMGASTRAGVFNRLNWEHLRPTLGQGLVDSNASPVIFWEPGTEGDSAVHASAIGSQADSMSAISGDYERWVKRITGWVRRKGTRVWGLDQSNVRPDLDIRLRHVSNVYALPDALAALEGGAAGRDSAH